MIMFPCPLGLVDFVGVDATQVELTAGDLEQRAQRPDGVGAGPGLQPQHEDGAAGGSHGLTRFLRNLRPACAGWDNCGDRGAQRQLVLGGRR